MNPSDKVSAITTVANRDWETSARPPEKLNVSAQRVYIGDTLLRALSTGGPDGEWMIQ